MRNDESTQEWHPPARISEEEDVTSQGEQSSTTQSSSKRIEIKLGARDCAGRVVDVQTLSLT